MASMVVLLLRSSTMRILIGLTILMATVGVGSVVAAPRPDQPVLAVFDAPLSGEDLLNKLARADLDLISTGPTMTSVIVSNPRTDTASRLYAVGAWLVVDAHMALLCLSSSPASKGDRFP